MTKYMVYKSGTPEGRFASIVAHYLAHNGIPNTAVMPIALQLIRAVERATEFEDPEEGSRELIRAMKSYNYNCDLHHPTFSRYNVEQFEDE